MNENIWTIYVHINRTNKKKYVGITSINPEDRWGANGHNYHNQVFGKAIKKYGWNNFDHKILDTNLSKFDACKKEKYYIFLWKTNNKEYGYNIQNGGCSYGKQTDEIKEKIRKANLGKNSPRSVMINQYELDGTYVKTWYSSRDIGRELNFDSTNVIACCKGKVNMSHGYMWKYYSDVNSTENINPIKKRIHIDEK